MWVYCSNMSQSTRVQLVLIKGMTPKTCPQFGLQAATRLHEARIASNRRSAIRRWIRLGRFGPLKWYFTLN
jgi:hypothetical protein